jgi:transposase
VGSLVPSQHPDLLRIPLEEFRPLAGERLARCLAYRTTKVVFGQERTIVITYNENLLEGQLQGIEAGLTKARRKLDALRANLRRRREGRLRHGRAPTAESIRKQVEQSLSGQFLKNLIHFELTPAPIPTLSYRTDTAALARLMRTHLGKTILFTDDADWTTEEIVLGYRAQDRIESAFRDMKNPHFLGWSPMFHWTDSKIRVHAFYCVLALTLTSLLQRTLHQHGLDLSLSRMMELLGGIHEVMLIYPRRQGEKRPRTATCLSERDTKQAQLLHVLGLERYQAAEGR